MCIKVWTQNWIKFWIKDLSFLTKMFYNLNGSKKEFCINSVKQNVVYLNRITNNKVKCHYTSYVFHFFWVDIQGFNAKWTPKYFNDIFPHLSDGSRVGQIIRLFIRLSLGCKQFFSLVLFSDYKKSDFSVLLFFSKSM